MAPRIKYNTPLHLPNNQTTISRQRIVALNPDFPLTSLNRLISSLISKGVLRRDYKGHYTIFRQVSRAINI